MFQALDQLLGAFIREGSLAGIILTPGILSEYNFTAAHELGHLVLDHEHMPTMKVSCGVDRRRGEPRYRCAPEEREADAFASYFLCQTG